MRILHLFKTSLPDSFGGIEQTIDQIARGAVRHGVTSDVLSLSRTEVVRDQPFHGYRRHTAREDLRIASTGLSLSAFACFARLARRADLIHYHFPWPFMDVLHFASAIRKPTLLTYHSDIVRQRHLLMLYRPLQRRFLGAMDRIVATSPNYLATSDVLAEHRDKVRVIPLGLDRDSYPQPDAGRLEWWRTRLDGRFFLFVGVLRYYKGLHNLLDAAAGLDCPIVIVGTGPLEQDLRDQARRLGLANVRFLGQLSEVDKDALLYLSHAVVLPSQLRSEAFGIALIEGAMFGKPMISTEIGTGTSFVNAHGETGLVVPPDNPLALRAALQQLWADPDAAAAMGLRARERYDRLFTAERMTASYVEAYRELTGAQAGAH